LKLVTLALAAAVMLALPAGAASAHPRHHVRHHAMHRHAAHRHRVMHRRHVVVHHHHHHHMQ